MTTLTAQVTVPVHLLMFGNVNQIRWISIPYPQEDKSLLSILELVFHYGQSDFQQQGHPSVSIGDAIEYQGKYYLCCNVGFKRLTKLQFDNYCLLSQMGKFMHMLQQKSNIH